MPLLTIEPCCSMHSTSSEGLYSEPSCEEQLTPRCVQSSHHGVFRAHNTVCSELTTRCVQSSQHGVFRAHTIVCSELTP
ncbi:hypothetical protein PoB_004715700 [Plakobranchus ocellatus]|uniref:Uncharacterized protein n=1 Tax=Plakobranchus ocellatus TaxID=259542 RepID=A0AAV4BMM6_9GAST|nr:hypothetical protein PoB_004715700 [Plakobranchus ocellatus]